MDTPAGYARAVWEQAEAVHAVTYFAPEAREAATAIGLRGFWMGYFAFRSAPLGPASAALVEATFFNFAPRRVERAIPDAWTFATPAAALDARAASAAATLRRLAPDVDAVAAGLLPLLGRLVDGGDPSAGPLFAVNRALAPLDDPVQALWQATTCLREHRGDGHLAVLRSASLDGLEAHLLQSLANGFPPALLREARGFTEEEWDGAHRRLQAGGIADDAGGLTDEGRALRAFVELRTDELASTLYAGLDEDERGQLRDGLRAVARLVRRSGLLPFPNPIGVPDAGSEPPHGAAG